MLESVIGTSITLQSFLLCTAVSLVLGIGLAFVAGYRQKTSSSFAVTLALLPAVVLQAERYLRYGFMGMV